MKQKTWFITGAGSGFGLLLTKKLLHLGERVAATTKTNFTHLDQLKSQYPEQLWLAKLDVTDIHAINQTVQAAFNDLGYIDVLVSNAGYVLLGALEEITQEQIQQQLDTNLRGPIFLIKAFLPHLRAQKQGRIIQVSSEAGQMTYPALSLYHASKWGIEGFCESLSREVATFGIHVTIVEPGRTLTGFDQHAITPPQTIEAYQKTTVGNYRCLLAMGKFPNIGDANKVIQQMIQAANKDKPPLRLTLGSDAYKNIYKSLNERINKLETQKETAFSTDKTS